MTKYSFLLFLFFSAFLSSEHAIYLSVVEISDIDKSVDITVKVFRDDMVDALRNNTDVLESTMDALDHEELRAYFAEHIKLYPATDQSLQVRSVTIEGDSFFINLFINRDFSTVQQLGLSHFFELFPTQKNIVKISTGGQLHYYTYKSASQIEDLIDLHW